MLREFWPSPDNGALGTVLVTTRNVRIKESFQTPSIQEAHHVFLEPLPEAEAVELILRETGGSSEEVPGTREMALTAARELGGLPVAIVDMASEIKRDSSSVQAYMESYLARQPSWWGRKGGADDGALRYLLVDLDSLPSDALHLVRFLSMLGPNTFSRSNLRTWKLFGAGDKQRKALDNAILALSSFPAFAINEKDKLSLQAAAGHEINSLMTINQWTECFSIAIDLFCKMWPKPDGIQNRYKAGRWPRCEAVFRFIDPVCKMYRSKGMTLAPACLRSMDVVKLFQDVGWYVHERGFSFEGKFYADEALDLFEAVGTPSPEDQAVLCDIHETLADISRDLGDVPSCMLHSLKVMDLHKTRLYEQRRRERRSVRPDLGLAWAHLQLAVAHMMSGQVSQGVANAEKCQELLQSLDSGGRLSLADQLAVPTMVLGLAYLEQNRFEEAESVVRASIKRRNAALNPCPGLRACSAKTGLLYYALCTIQCTSQDESRARTRNESIEQWRENRDFRPVPNVLAVREAWRLALDHLRRIVGDHHPWVAAVLYRGLSHWCDFHDDPFKGGVNDEFYPRRLEDIDTALKIWGEKPYYRGQVARAYDLLHYTCKKPAEEYGRKAPNKEDPRLAAVYQPGFWLDKAKGLGAEMLGERLRTDPSAYFELRGELVSFWYK